MTGILTSWMGVSITAQSLLIRNGTALRMRILISLSVLSAEMVSSITKLKSATTATPSPAMAVSQTASPSPRTTPASLKSKPCLTASPAETENGLSLKPVMTGTMMTQTGANKTAR